MNIDKFGHHIHKRLRISEYIDTLNDTLTKSETGDFNLKLSRLKGLLHPEEDNDAVNKAYLDKEIQDLRAELKQIHTNVKNYLSGLEKAVLANISSKYYTKADIDSILAKLNKK